MKRAVRHVCLTAAFLLLATPSATPNVFGDIWNGIKNGAEAVGKLAAAPFGGFANGLTAPAVDHAASAFKDVADQAIDRIDQVVGENIKKVDAVAERRIQQLDAVVKARLDQVDAMLDKDLKRVDDIITRALDREGALLDTTITRVDDIIDKDIDRLQDIQRDTFERLQAALEDQLPVATSQLAQQLVWSATIIIFLLVLVGYGGVQFFRGFFQAKGSLLQRALASGERGWAAILTAAGPMVTLTIILLGSYEAYLRVAESKRLARLEDAAGVLEKAADFKAAAVLRRRTFSLSGDDDQRFLLARDVWLGDVTQAHRPLDAVELLIRYGAISGSDKIKDGELEAAHLYLLERVRDRSQPPPADLVAAADNYRKAFLSAPEGGPVLGKLVLMVRISLFLDDRSRPVNTRLADGAAVASELEKKYKTYAQGLLVLAQIQAMQADVDEQGPKSKAVDQKARGQIAELVSRAANADADMARIVKVTQLRLPDKASDTLRKAIGAGAGPNQDAANKALAEFVDRTLLPQAQAIFRNEQLARVRSEQALWFIVRRDLGERDVVDRVKAARGVNTGGSTTDLQRFKAFLEVADQAQQIDEYAIAEAWLSAAEDLRKSKAITPDAGDQDRIKRVKSAIETGDLKALFIVL